MESFFDFYKLQRSTTDITDKFKKGSTNKICKFCNDTYPNVSFETAPHIVPELFGRNKLTSNFECDTCNQKFQKFESDTSTMIQHYLALLNIKTKNRVPIFQSKKNSEEHSTTLKTINNNRNLNFGTNKSDFEFNEEEKLLIVKFRTRKFRPYSVYKIFLKMGISLLDEDELKENNHYIEFLNSEEPIMNGMQIWTTYRYTLKTKYNPTPIIDLYKAKKTIINGTVFPEYVVLINFANIIFQFFMPISKKNIDEHKEENSLRLELFPSFILDNPKRTNEILMHYFNLNETDKISITDKVILQYESRESREPS